MQITLVREAPVQQNSHLIVPLASIFTKISQVIETLKLSHLFEGEIIRKIDIWQSTFYPKFQNIDNAEKQEIASLALCYLLYEMIYPTFLGKNPQQLEELYKYVLQLKEIMEIIIPNLNERGQLIRDYESYSKEEAILKRKIAEIEMRFQEYENQLYVNANRINNLILAKFEELRQALLEINTQRDLIIDECISTHLEKLNERVANVYAQLCARSDEIIQLSQTLQNEELVFHQHLNEGLEVLNKV